MFQSRVIKKNITNKGTFLKVPLLKNTFRDLEYLYKYCTIKNIIEETNPWESKIIKNKLLELVVLTKNKATPSPIWDTEE